MSTTYRKTAKGVSEIETRAHRLTPRMRSALILVDGRRSDVELRTLVQQQADETLAALEAQGFIEVVSVSDNRLPPRAAPSVAPLPAAPARDLVVLRREAVRELTDKAGPTSETLAIRIERSRTLEELRPLLETAAQLIGGTRGAQAAAGFRARYIDT